MSSEVTADMTNVFVEELVREAFPNAVHVRWLPGSNGLRSLARLVVQSEPTLYITSTPQEYVDIRDNVRAKTRAELRVLADTRRDLSEHPALMWNGYQRWIRPDGGESGIAMMVVVGFADVPPQGWSA